MTTRIAKFIGGPLDGQVKQVPLLALELRVPMPPARPMAAPDEGPLAVAVIRYLRREILGVEVWTPEAMRDTQIIELLVQRYARS